MDYSALARSSLFAGIPAGELQKLLPSAPERIRHYDRDEIIFRLMAKADQIGIVLHGRAEAQKAFANGGQVNVSLRGPGEVIGAAAVFSAARVYPCDIVAAEKSAVMLFRREDLLTLMQKDVRILKNLMQEIATAATMLQQRLELLSYRGIAQKAAFWLLTQARQTGNTQVMLPGSVTSWAMMLNVSRPSLHRELKKLEDQGILTYAPPFIQLLDPEALQALLASN